MRDFTLSMYKQLIRSLIKSNYAFQTMEDFFESPEDKCIIFRHDVDRLPQNALRMAKLENEIGVKATYYFRSVSCSYNENIIKNISGLRHEIGYHYENLSECKGNFIKAIKDFEVNLEKFRELYPVKSIVMHGSPLSKYDNRLLWEKYDYKDYGVLSEPYFDIDFNEFAYFTDTGRRWNSDKVSVRDKVNSKFNFNFKTTQQIIDNIDQLPPKIMFTVHPQRWHDNLIFWCKELVLQNVKNIFKKLLFVR